MKREVYFSNVEQKSCWSKRILQ